jgi:hypothetical protein
MASLDKDTIEDLARGALDALRRGPKDDSPIEEATAGLREQYDRVVGVIRQEYGQTRQTARGEIDGFLNDLKGIDPALPGIVAEAANEMTGRKKRSGWTVLGVVVLLIVGVATLLWWRSPETYRQLLDAVNRAARES